MIFAASLSSVTRCELTSISDLFDAHFVPAGALSALVVKNTLK